MVPSEVSQTLGKLRQKYLPDQLELHNENLSPQIAQPNCEENKMRQTQLEDILQAMEPCGK